MRAAFRNKLSCDKNMIVAKQHDDIKFSSVQIVNDDQLQLS